MLLFQYWDAPDPPAQIAEWMGLVRRRTPGLEHRLFDRATAAELIAVRLGPRQLAAFEACAVPAMQADYFRLCALDALGGVYLDADSQPRRPLGPFLACAPEALLITFGGYIMTGVLMFRTAKNPFVGALLELATRNIEDRCFSSVFTTTGPALADAVRALVDPRWLTAIQARDDREDQDIRFGQLLDRARAIVPVTPDLISAFRGVTLVRIVDAVRWVGTPIEPDYKLGARHWRNWSGPIFRESVAA